MATKSLKIKIRKNSYVRDKIQQQILLVRIQSCRHSAQESCDIQLEEDGDQHGRRLLEKKISDQESRAIRI